MVESFDCPAGLDTRKRKNIHTGSIHFFYLTTKPLLFVMALSWHEHCTTSTITVLTYYYYHSPNIVLALYYQHSPNTVHSVLS